MPSCSFSWLGSLSALFGLCACFYAVHVVVVVVVFAQWDSCSDHMDHQSASGLLQDFGLFTYSGLLLGPELPINADAPI